MGHKLTILVESFFFPFPFFFLLEVPTSIRFHYLGSLNFSSTFPTALPTHPAMSSPGLHTPAAHLHSIFRVGIHLVFILTLSFLYLSIIYPFLSPPLSVPQVYLTGASELVSTLRNELNCP